jgi:hypothetical protein
MINGIPSIVISPFQAVRVLRSLAIKALERHIRKFLVFIEETAQR